jgi:hypothetical protein
LFDVNELPPAPKPQNNTVQSIVLGGLSFSKGAVADFTGIEVRGLESKREESESIEAVLQKMKITEADLPKEFTLEKSFKNIKFTPGAIVDFSNAEVVGIPSVKDNIIVPQNRNTAYIVEDSASLTSLIANILISGKTMTTDEKPIIAVQFDVQLGREYVIEATSTVKDYVDAATTEDTSFNTVHARCSTYAHKNGVNVIPHGDRQFSKDDDDALDGIKMNIVPVTPNKLTLIISGLPFKNLHWWYTVKVTGNGSVCRITHVNNQKA